MSVTPGHPNAALLRNADPKRRIRIVGEVAGVVAASALHRKMLAWELAANILPPLDLGQFRIYRRAGQVVGYVSWAFLSREAEALYRTGEYGLQPQDWNSGECGWIVDFIAPFGDARAIARDLRTNVFPGRTGNSFRVRSGRAGQGVRVMRGGSGADS